MAERSRIPNLDVETQLLPVKWLVKFGARIGSRWCGLLLFRSCARANERSNDGRYWNILDNNALMLSEVSVEIDVSGGSPA